MTSDAPAFKEWHVIVEALLAGEQLLVLRKGGIAEGRSGFSPDHARRFWLFPSRFHAQAEKTKPAAARHFTPAASDEFVTLQAFAEVAHHAFITDWDAVARLDSLHIWTTATVRERFDWSTPPGIHAFVLRVHRCAAPITLPLTPDLAGCKSWVEVPLDFDTSPSAPVLGDAAFAARLEELKALLSPEST